VRPRGLEERRRQPEGGGERRSERGEDEQEQRQEDTAAPVAAEEAPLPGRGSGGAEAPLERGGFFPRLFVAVVAVVVVVAEAESDRGAPKRDIELRWELPRRWKRGGSGRGGGGEPAGEEGRKGP